MSCRLSQDSEQHHSRFHCLDLKSDESRYAFPSCLIHPSGAGFRAGINIFSASKILVELGPFHGDQPLRQWWCCWRLLVKSDGVPHRVCLFRHVRFQSTSDRQWLYTFYGSLHTHPDLPIWVFAYFGVPRKMFLMFGLFSRLRTCNVSVPASGSFVNAGTSIFQLKRCPERSGEVRTHL